MPSPIAFENTYAQLPDTFYAHIHPATVPNPQWIRFNSGLAVELGLDPDWLESPAGLAMLSGNRLPPGSEPIAQAYAGHQFGGWVPQLGDGRAILLGEIVDPDGIRRDLQLKGSGRTPWSRGGDGKAALGPVLREYLLSEAMHALGVPTTRALAAVRTGEAVQRETRLPGAIVTRIARSHIRVGTFQYFYARNDTEALRQLADHAIDRHYPEARVSDHPYRFFLGAVVQAQARLIAHWMHLGFIHGVMNTDNMTVSGETIDYGPCAFIDTFHPNKVFSSIDMNGRYAWNNQPGAAHWNLMRLAEALSPLLAQAPDEAREVAEAIVETFGDHFTRHFAQGWERKLGLPTDPETGGRENEAFVTETLKTLTEQQLDFTLFFRHLTRAANGDSESTLAGLFKNEEAFTRWFHSWQERTNHGTAAEKQTRWKKMKRHNPILIPRNHRIEEAIQSASAGDDQPFHRLAEAFTAPYEDRPEWADLEQPPQSGEEVRQTFCGT